MKTILKFSQFFLSLFLNIDVNLQSCRKYSIYLLQIIKPCITLHGSSRLSWICSTLPEFRKSNTVAACSICSLSGLTSCRPSANPLVVPAILKEPFKGSFFISNISFLQIMSRRLLLFLINLLLAFDMFFLQLHL